MSNDLNNKSGGQNSGLDDFDRLLASLFDGGLSDAQWDSLCQQMADDPHVRQRYIQFVQLHSLLETRYSLQQHPTLPDGTDEPNTVDGDSARELQNLARQQLSKSPIKTRTQKKESSFTTAKFSAWRIAAVLVFVATAVFALTSPLWMGWKKAAPLATLADAVDAQWDTPLDVGDALPSGPLVLKAGYAHIALSNGVNLVLKGPAHFSVESLLRVQLDVGKLTADVPHTAVGFTVKTPTASVTDLGTTFGVTAFANGEGEVQVLKGKVQAKLLDDHGATKVQTELTQDHAVAINPFLGTVASIPVEPDAYVTDIHHIPAVPQTPYARWLAYSTKLRKDPSLLAYYAFDNQAEAPQHLLNRAAATSSKYDGQIENATWDEGRFPGKQALRFNGNDSRVKINIPEQSNQLTFAMWVRMDSLPHEIVGLLMSDDFITPGEIAWQIVHGKSNVTVREALGEREGGGTLNSPSPADAVGQWVFLATTLDAQSSSIIFYRNGVAQVSQKVSNAVPMSIGAAQIGSWNALSSTDRVRNRTLHGRIDELAVFNRVLSDAEIQAMYQAECNEK